MNAASFRQNFAKKLDSLGGDFVTSWLDAAPNGRGACDDLHIGRERLDDNIALVTNGFKRGGNRLPIDMVVARRTAIAATSMEVGEVLAGFADGGALILLFDIHVKSIEMKAKGFAPDVFDHFQALIAGVD